MAALFWQFSSHKMAKKQNFQNRYTKFVELRTENLQTKFKVLNIKAVQMNVPFVTFQYRDLKVFRVLYLQENRDFQKIITQVRNNVFSCVFLHLVHLNEIFKN